MSESSSTAARYACRMSGWSLTNLKLQKILYIARMVFVGRTKDQLLIDEAFKAWDFGPVLPSLYHRVRLSDDGHGSRDSQGRAWCELSAGTGFGGVAAAALHGTRERSVAFRFGVLSMSSLGPKQAISSPPLTQKLFAISAAYVGEPGGTRTHDPKIKSLVLYHLSYGLAGRLRAPSRRSGQPFTSAATRR
jgi:hypothetical protein